MCISFTLRNHSHGKIHMRKNLARVLAAVKNQRSKAGGGGGGGKL